MSDDTLDLETEILADDVSDEALGGCHGDGSERDYLCSDLVSGFGGLQLAHLPGLTLHNHPHPPGPFQIGITLDLYIHVLSNMRADAAAIVDDALRAALNKHGPKG